MLKIANDLIQIAVCTNQGRLPYMEDRYSINMSLDPNYPNKSFFAIFDGHGGSFSAKFCARELPRRLGQAENISNESLKKIIADLDNDLLAEDRKSGTTCTFVIIDYISLEVIIGNIGDSRVLIGNEDRIIFRTRDHVPNIVAEQQRIEAAGGYIKEGRVDGRLAMSRALGDWSFKTPLKKVICDPDISRRDMSRFGKYWWILLGSDGLFQEGQVSANKIRNIINSYPKSNVAEVLCNYPAKTDNISVIFISPREPWKNE